MPNKIKIAFILVAIVAVFSVYELAQYVHATANKQTFQQGSPLPSPDDDPDHDGLSNQQEIIWGTDPFNPDSDKDGFKDGEEVKSGHNPLIPGPNDLVNADNLTDQLSLLTLSGLYAGALNPDSKDYDKSLSDISSAIADSGKYVFNKQIDPAMLHMVQGGASNAQVYIKELTPLTSKFGDLLTDQYSKVENNLNHIGVSGFDSTIKKYYSVQALAYKNIQENGLNMSVPAEFKSSHIQFLSLVGKLQTISEAIAIGDKDPVKASLAFSAFGDTYPSYLDIAANYLDNMKEAGFDIPNISQ